MNYWQLFSTQNKYYYRLTKSKFFLKVEPVMYIASPAFIIGYDIFCMSKGDQCPPYAGMKILFYEIMSALKY